MPTPGEHKTVVCTIVPRNDCREMPDETKALDGKHAENTIP